MVSMKLNGWEWFLYLRAIYITSLMKGLECLAYLRRSNVVASVSFYIELSHETEGTEGAQRFGVSEYCNV